MHWSRRMTTPSNCDVPPVVVDVGLEKLEEVLRFSAYPDGTSGRTHERASPRPPAESGES